MNWKFTRESQLAHALVSEINPFWSEQVTTGQFTGKHNVKVHYAWCMPLHPRSAVVVSSGRIEALLKYKEVIYDFWRNDVAVFILDHRGQGQSGRMTEDPHQGYVADFEDYVDDLLYFVQQIVQPCIAVDGRGPLPLHLLCHSMGSAIGALAILREPTLFQRAVFCSPMFGIRPPLPHWFAEMVIGASRAVNSLSRLPAAYFFRQKGYHAVAFDDNRLTHSNIRYQLFRELYEQQPELQLGGVTTQWLYAAYLAIAAIEKRAADITLPVLVLSASEDKVVDNVRQKRIAAKFGDCQYEVVHGAFHELLIESDEYRDKALCKILTFLS
ncbi:alpha/beta fold hydrolase [Alteromonas pelagimontana]|uniref:Alpha/beta fold hydrolase n=1 Tax=Alteromonas pelagimontana TaxID=1858656 RepID=A0A6M4MBK4_9ALTE|nr:alpha/beta fold hydrolase [Alteromonas pelagimontana]QJR80533.1 alpha/beta fold hydrolase [Alteromonas pelagimontana]